MRTAESGLSGMFARARSLQRPDAQDEPRLLCSGERPVEDPEVAGPEAQPRGSPLAGPHVEVLGRKDGRVPRRGLLGSAFSTVWLVMPPVATANTAKLYCLRLIEAQVAPLSAAMLLDLGCGEGGTFAELLRQHPHVRYIGVDPREAACARARDRLAGLNATIINSSAYDLDVGPADIVTSFSVLEHVYQRRRYLECARRNLAANGICCINYDAGHFVSVGTPRHQRREQVKCRVGRVLAAFGHEGKFQSFVREDEFKSLAKQTGFEIVDERFFNSDLKSVWKVVPEHARSEFTKRWLELELWLNESGLAYQDEMAPLFRTRNFVLKPRDAEVTS